MSASSPQIVWFRQDLRVGDHPALRKAVDSDQPVVCVFILDVDAAGDWAPGGASRWWLHGSLAALDAALRDRGNRLVLRRGDSLPVLKDLIETTGAERVLALHSADPWQVDLDRRVAEGLDKPLELLTGNTLFDLGGVLNQSDLPYKVYTPFWRAVLKHGDVVQPKPAPRKVPAPDSLPESDELAHWALRPTAPDWANRFHEFGEPGEQAAQQRLDAFVDTAVSGYGDGRDRPDRDATSRLSAHLHFGDISPRQVWHAVLASQAAQGDPTAENAEPFLRQIVWREFAQNLLWHMPDLPEEPMRGEFRDFDWVRDDNAFEAWCQGQTGYPIVDAGMRQLWHTGWMHNRLRMIVASFLVKHLMIPWQKGERWFWDTLVDADLSNNAMGWQWVAGCGPDAAPYFRIFNPITQGEKFDPDGDYVRTWVPEIADLPDAYLNKPWEAPEMVLKGAGVVLGKTYPHPLVDHARARKRALDAFDAIKKN